jgi:hypothetical protein
MNEGPVEERNTHSSLSTLDNSSSTPRYDLLSANIYPTLASVVAEDKSSNVIKILEDDVLFDSSDKNEDDVVFDSSGQNEYDVVFDICQK